MRRSQHGTIAAEFFLQYSYSPELMSDDKPRLPWSIAPAPPQAASLPAQENPAHAIPALAETFPSNRRIHTTNAPIYAAILVAGIIIGALLATLWASYKEHKSPTYASTAEASTTTKPTVTPTAPALVVEDQRAGQTVTIQGLNIAKPTWVVVYVSREGKPGNALGARLYFAGDKQGSVGLLRNTQPGQTYLVGLSVDNGDRTFSLAADHALPDADGGPLLVTFRAQ